MHIASLLFGNHKKFLITYTRGWRFQYFYGQKQHLQSSRRYSIKKVRSDAENRPLHPLKDRFRKMVQTLKQNFGNWFQCSAQRLVALKRGDSWCNFLKVYLRRKACLGCKTWDTGTSSIIILRWPLSPFLFFSGLFSFYPA